MTSEPSERELRAIAGFLARYFPEEYSDEQRTLGTGRISDDEMAEIESLVHRSGELFSESKGTLGLALDFLMVAESLSQRDHWLIDFQVGLGRNDIFDRYEQAATKATLTLKYDGERFGIRSVHEEITDLFRGELQRTNFPSAAPHYTGEWERYQDLLEWSFRLSRAGRYKAAWRLFELGLDRLEANTLTTREPTFPRPFLSVLQEYPRQHADEEAGSVYQGLAYGYVKAEWPHLSLRASKLRTGSARQHRYGDIDGYVGPDLMISVEAKDKRIDASNVSKELGSMMELAEKTTAIAIAMCRTVDDAARERLTDAAVQIITDRDIKQQLATWDYHKQNRALQGMIHFLANVEENPDATQRLLSFLSDVDPENPALAHLAEASD